jgi:TolB-like protein/DNA-binding winged helix-turn-helix (wHTH) protein/Tfp pilus assembly protein PilF
MQAFSPKSYCFEAYTLDLRRGCLRKVDREIDLRPKSFEVLRHLVENAGRLVSKDELLKITWPDVIVTDECLTQCVSEVRRALGDGDQRLIKTVPRRGYLFAASVSSHPTERAVFDAPMTDASAQVKGKVDVVTQEEQRLKSIAEPTRMYSVSLDEVASKSAPALALPDTPSIAVLPFQNMSGDPEQEYFTDGVVEEIITALSRFRHLFVIARNSSFTYKGRSASVKQVGRELRVRYVLEGSVRKAANKMRIAGQLIDTSLGTHLWADRFDGSLEDIFDLQDQVTACVVGAIAPKLEQAEIERAKRKPTESLDAYDLYLRGVACIYQYTKDGFNDALHSFYRAIELDPDFASPYGMAARCYARRFADGWITDRVRETAETARLARGAAKLGKDDAVALTNGGFGLACVVGDIDNGAAMIDRALLLNPNLAAAWTYGGWVWIWRGQPEVALDHFARAMRLNPLDPNAFSTQAGTASAHFFAGRYDEASSWAKRSLREQPSHTPPLRILASSSALAGRLEDAQAAIARLRHLEPTFRISDLRDRTHLHRPQDLATFADGLRKAGLPE